jgi:hypothetical protein
MTSGPHLSAGHSGATVYRFGRGVRRLGWLLGVGQFGAPGPFSIFLFFFFSFSFLFEFKNE